MIRCYLCNKSSCEISSLLNIPQSAYYKVEAIGNDSNSWPCKMTEQGQQMLRRIVRRGCQLSAESITTELQTSRELDGIGFHDRAAASKPYSSKCNTKHQMQWCKARHHWTLEQWRRVLWTDESRPRDVRQSHAPNFVGTVWGWPLPVPTWLCTSAQSKVHKDMDERVLFFPNFTILILRYLSKKIVMFDFVAPS